MARSKLLTEEYILSKGWMATRDFELDEVYYTPGKQIVLYATAWRLYIANEDFGQLNYERDFDLICGLLELSGVDE